ncbi:pantetheine-phosphate adenylyltransferase [Lutispora sp.]|uniref:pantetheine-phosphate adenylyltransferase n=1 Tax=Lutispora sp. TaxID=2828727 RepID=UPI000ED78C51|nr:pantetheine-phosphate adenylyltransferase [Lutispora sp.]MEA4960128.1 pantetheine-phosphate adenylyltransferase [Lutispora sp.]HCJ57722.1 pantetheine-phosphate adenylyltransferase [Clostridiaceae bacterium]
MKIGVYPGSFDPVTNGHLDIIERASKLFDKLIVGVGVNNNKKSLFSVEKRLEFIEVSCKSIPNVEVDSFSGLLIEFMREKNANTIVKGLRAISDFEYEFQMALMNRKLNPEIETIFMMTSSKYSYLSSSLIKEVAGFGGCVRGLIPEVVEKELHKKL